MKNGGGFVVNVNISSGTGIKGWTSNLSAINEYRCLGYRNKKFGVVFNAYTGFFNTTTHACSVNIGKDKYIKFTIGGTLYSESCTTNINEDVKGNHFKDCKQATDCHIDDNDMFDTSDGGSGTTCSRVYCIENYHNDQWNNCNCNGKDW